MSLRPPQIRLATAADVPTLASLRYEFRAALDPASETVESFIRRCEQWMGDRLTTPGPWRCWMAEDGRNAVGMAWLMIIEKMPNPVGEPECYGYVSSLYVKPEYRGHGLGAGLLESCIRECESRICDSIFLWPTARSRSLYLRHGFEVRSDLLERRLVPISSHGQ